ncbi:MAG: T9SS type A sorting domain-containing protein [Saprospiraceae bacterium]
MKYIILSVLLALFYQITDAQEWAPIGAKWTYRKKSGLGKGSSYYNFTVEKDTIVKKQNCRKITKKGDLFCFKRQNVEFTFSRNDSIFFYDKILDTFQVLYNFKAKRGDNWSLDFPDYQPSGKIKVTIQVDSTGTKVINNQSLKVLFVTYKMDRLYRKTYSSTIIEKLGDLETMLNYAPSSINDCKVDYPDRLTCYYDDTLGNYPFQTVDSCTYFWIATKDLHSLNNLIYPNPAFDKINIPEEFQSDFYSIYDSTGRVVLEGIISESRISIVNLKEGLYFLSIFNSSGEKLINRKIAKM